MVRGTAGGELRQDRGCIVSEHPETYETQRRILEDLSEANRKYREERGARLVSLPTPPYWRVVSDARPSPRRAA